MDHDHRKNGVPQRLISLVTICFLLAACTSVPGIPASPTAPPLPPTIEPSAALALPTSTGVPTQAPTIASTDTPVAGVETATAALDLAETPSTGSGVEEAILILEPGPGSRVVSPIHISGMADSTFEQNLGMRLVLDDGTELVRSSVTIATEMGQRGPFEGDLDFTIEGERQAFLQVFASSARDGGITHLASAGVILTNQGAADLRQNEVHDERIRIDQPVQGEEIQGGSLHVEGFALASFEQALVVELLAESGEVLSSQPVTVTAPDLGIPGTFEADLTYPPGMVGAGRVVVRDPSPAFEGDVHVASVEVRFTP